jgi:hypothetical protein
MIMLVVFGFLTGMLFGLRFTVLVLVPVIMLTWMLTISIDAMRGLGFWWVVLDMFVLSTALQFGYVAGGALAILRSALESIFELVPEEPLRHRRPSGLILPFRFRDFGMSCQLEHPECPEG